jgi:hypothetical protein
MSRLIAPPYTTFVEKEFHLQDFSTSADYSSGNVLSPGYRIKTPERYGFPPGATIKGDFKVWLKISNAGSTAKARLIINDGDDIIQPVAGSEVTITGTTALTELSINDLTLMVGKKYYWQIGCSSIVQTAQFWGGNENLKY